MKDWWRQRCLSRAGCARCDISMILSRCLYVWSVTDVHVQVTKALRLVVYSSSFCMADGNVCYIVLQHHVQHMANANIIYENVGAGYA